MTLTPLYPLKPGPTSREEYCARAAAIREKARRGEARTSDVVRLYEIERWLESSLAGPAPRSTLPDPGSTDTGQ